MVEQSSASDRIERAKKSLALFDQLRLATGVEKDLADALRAFITPPAVGESEDQIVRRVLSTYQVTDEDLPLMQVLAKESVRAGIQSAHETWEPEVAQRPSQEQMLRWLGIDHQDYTDGDPQWIIPAQFIEKEVL